MAAGDKFLHEVSAKVLLASLHSPEMIRYRQRVLADCLAQPEVIRQMYAVAAGVLEDKRHLWGGYGGSYQSASSNLSGAVSYLEAYVARLRQLRQVADDHAGKFSSGGLTALFATLQRELDDAHAPTCAIPAWRCNPRNRSPATTCKVTGSRWSSSPAPTPEENPRSCAAPAWPSS